MTIWYIPQDAAARSVGADDVATALAKRGDAVVRTGSRGMLWLEPLVERASSPGEPRVGWSNVTTDDVMNDRLQPEADTYLGVVADLDYLAKQDRWVFERVGVIDPLDPDDYLAHGGMAGLKAALDLSPEDVVGAVIDSGLRGRGGAGFPAGIKWRTVAQTPPCPHAGDPASAPAHKYICINADEGDSGTFADRMLIEGDPLCLLEGMTIAAYSVGADRG
ncbi:MAG TPA: formate dehydrogenase, partial [Acidimicrobiia bacterium]